MSDGEFASTVPVYTYGNAKAAVALRRQKALAEKTRAEHEDVMDRTFKHIEAQSMIGVHGSGKVRHGDMFDVNYNARVSTTLNDLQKDPSLATVFFKDVAWDNDDRGILLNLEVRLIQNTSRITFGLILNGLEVTALAATGNPHPEGRVHVLLPPYTASPLVVNERLFSRDSASVLTQGDSLHGWDLMTEDTLRAEIMPQTEENKAIGLHEIRFPSTVFQIIENWAREGVSFPPHAIEPNIVEEGVPATSIFVEQNLAESALKTALQCLKGQPLAFPNKVSAKFVRMDGRAMNDVSNVVDKGAGSEWQRLDAPNEHIELGAQIVATYLKWSGKELMERRSMMMDDDDFENGRDGEL